MFECSKTLSTNKSSSSPLPCIDHLGGIGTLGHRLLFGHDPHKAPQPTTTNPSNRHSLLLYNAAYGPLAPTDLLRRPDENWTRSHPYSRFAPSYHTSLPSHWAQQLLGLNLTVTLHNHFHKRIRALQSRHSRSHPPTLAIFNNLNHAGVIPAIPLSGPLFHPLVPLHCGQRDQVGVKQRF
jgi:hypothetical protein